MLKKRKLPNDKVRVTFSMSALEGVGQLFLVGEFNEWHETATPMTQHDDGSWSVALTLENNREYHYRYLADGHTWHNDWQADAYARNQFGSDNSVVSLLTEEKPQRTRKKKL